MSESSSKEQKEPTKPVVGSTVSVQIGESGTSSFVLAPEMMQQASSFSGSTVLTQVPPLDLLNSESGESVPSTVVPKSESNAPIQRTSTGDLPIGTVLGHFKITNYIGGGGMGSVYEGIDQALDRKVAIKILPQQRAQDQGSIARFLNEAKSAARLNHEHIAQVYFCGEERGIPFIAFEYVEGINVRSYIQEHGPIPLPQTINFILQMVSALAHASMHGVTHRDVKPSNIMITPRGNAKLIDMGLARLLKPTDGEYDLTASGVTLGTFDYISPEQARDPRNADVRSDIYSLGCTFFYMLAGQPPFPEGTVLQKLLKHQGDEPPDIRKIVPDIPVEVSMIIQKMMAKNPKNRFQNPNALIEVLIQAAEMIGLRPTGPGKTHWELPAVPQRQILIRQLPWIIPIFLLFTIVLTIRFLGESRNGNLVPSLLPASKNTPENPNQIIENEKKDKNSPVPEIPLVKTPFFLPAHIRILSDPTLDSLYKSKEEKIIPADRNVPKKEIVSTGVSKALIVSHSVSSPSPKRLSGGFDIIAASSKDVLSDWKITEKSPDQIRKTALFFGEEYPAESVNWSLAETMSESASRTEEKNKPNQESSLPFIVDRKGNDPNCFSSLQGAFSAALESANAGGNQKSEIQIELRFNGPLEVSPLALIDQKIRLYAPPEYHPVLIFQTNEEINGIGERLFLLNGSDLILQNVSVDFTVPPLEVISMEWSLFEMVKGSSLSLINSSLTVRNSTRVGNFQPRHTNVVFFRANPFRNEFSEPEIYPALENGEIKITLENSFIRGEAGVLHCKEQCKGRFTAVKSIFNVIGCLINYEEPRLLEQNDLLEVSLKEVIGIFRSPLIYHEQKEGQGPLFPFTINLSNSLIKLDNFPLLAAISNYPDTNGGKLPKLNIASTIFLNVSGYRRYRQYQPPDLYKDEPLSSQTSLSLEMYSETAADKLKKTVPHLCTKEDILNSIFIPLEGNLPSEGERNTLKILRQLF
ncbi:MAG: serine/threonine-protein kinase [Planctomycetia bacterium]|nr:serine/threonine-protein kinase [Planctomycetia bacterium]